MTGNYYTYTCTNCNIASITNKKRKKVCYYCKNETLEKKDTKK